MLEQIKQLFTDSFAPTNTFLGEFDVDLKDTQYKDFGPKEWSMYFIECYGQIDGDHHKAWVLDQIARIMHGTGIVIKEARWSDGSKELRIETGEPTKEYHQWVKDMQNVGEEEYEYNAGIAP